MTGPYTYIRSSKPMVGVAMGGCVFAALFCKIDEMRAGECDLFAKAVWAGLEGLRSVILLADWQAVLAYLWEDSRFLQHLLQIGACLWPLLRAMAG